MALVARIRSSTQVYPPMLWLLAVGSFLNIAGLSFLWPLNSIYIHDHLGRPLTVAGIVLMLMSAGGAVGSLTGGWLYDRVGARPVLLTGLLTAATVIAVPGFTTSWPLYVTSMILFGTAGSVAFPVMYALATRVWPEGGRRAFNFIYVANNLGVAVGTAIGGMVAQQSFQWAFRSASLTLMLFALFTAFYLTNRRLAAATKGGRSSSGGGATAGLDHSVVPWLPIGALFGSMLLLGTIYVQWQGAVAVHMQSSGFSLSAYSLLWTLNGLLIFAAQPLLALAMKAVRTTASQLWLGIALYMAAFSALVTSSHYAAFVVSMVLLTLGEMLLWPGIPAAVAVLSPPARRGFLQGFIGSAATFGRMLGPLLGGLLYDSVGFHILMIAAVGALLIPAVGIAVYRQSTSRTDAKLGHGN